MLRTPVRLTCSVRPSKTHVIAIPKAMNFTCPNCRNPVSHNVHGGLFEDRCTNCDWHAEGTYSWPILPPQKAIDVEVIARVSGTVRAKSLKVLRELSPAASALSPDQLVEALNSPDGLRLGTYPPYRATEITEQLSSLNFLLECLEHEV